MLLQLLGMNIQGTLHPLYSSLSTLFSWLCCFWGEGMDEFTNTFLPNGHSTCSGGKNSWHYYIHFLTPFFSPSASEFFIGLGKPSWLSSSKNSLTCGKWIYSPSKMSQGGLSSHKRDIFWRTKNWKQYGLSSCSSDKQGMSCLMHTPFYLSSYFS